MLRCNPVFFDQENLDTDLLRLSGLVKIKKKDFFSSCSATFLGLKNLTHKKILSNLNNPKKSVSNPFYLQTPVKSFKISELEFCKTPELLSDSKYFVNGF
jgi:hypothetical protein